ncbi:hypothetical protein [Erythrobacter dokdonensis]|uniref:hypothetical protein n=1 Tax=Erythrobacter dokdonensis TaxID=328225 RepID=UPI00083A2B3B|nr:hypothetical protein [Erythrobacter dokdonensis]
MFIGSATRTAPPCSSATPAAAADSFAMASLSDIAITLLSRVGEERSLRPSRLMQSSFDGIRSPGAIGLTLGADAKVQKLPQNRGI